MNKTLKLAGTFLALALGSTAIAVPLSGNYGLAGGQANLNSISVNTATGVISWMGTTTVSALAGTLAAYNGQTVTLDPWSFNSGAQLSLWETTNLQFDLISSSITTQGGGAVDVGGVGNLFVKGDQAGTTNRYSFNFTSQDPSLNPLTGSTTAGYAFTFSASGNPVPESGATAAMLGAALVGLGLIARRRRSAA